MGNVSRASGVSRACLRRSQLSPLLYVAMHARWLSLIRTSPRCICKTLDTLGCFAEFPHAHKPVSSCLLQSQFRASLWGAQNSPAWNRKLLQNTTGLVQFSSRNRLKILCFCLKLVKKTENFSRSCLRRSQYLRATMPWHGPRPAWAPTLRCRSGYLEQIVTPLVALSRDR